MKGEYPENWGRGIIIPIFKGGNLDDPSNYRGITLINIISKIYSTILLNRLTKWCNEHEVINNVQFGFQKGKSTAECIFILNAIITKTLSSKKKLYCAFVDFQKCFDTIDRIFLWNKLKSLNISTTFTNAIQSMYNTVRSCVRYNGSYSDFISSKIGVKQGDPSSSLLFLLFVNDIINNIDSNIDGIFTYDEVKFFMLLFADDTALFAQNPEALQSMLYDLERYCNTWGITINIKKTKIMIFEKGKHTNYDFKLSDEVLEVVQHFRYLGIYFYKNGSWYRTHKRIAQQASYALHNLFIIFNQMNLYANDKCRLFDSLVGSVLNYNASIWGNGTCSDIEKIHSKFLRKVLGVNRSTNLDALYGDLGRYPMKINRQLLMIKYWIKIKQSNNPLIDKIYEMMYIDAENNISYNGANWAYNIKQILDNTGLSYIWMNQNSTETTYSQIKQRILDIYKQSWYSRINNSHRLESYRLFKFEFELENYLTCIRERKYQISYSKFRLSSHKLAIEQGRHLRIDKHQRLCTNCNMGMIENEYHFLLICPKFTVLRKQYFKSYYCKWPNINKFISLMSSTSVKTLNNIGKYLHKAFESRG